MQRVGTRLRGPDGDLFALAERQPAGEEILNRQPINHAQAGDRCLNGAQDVEPKAGAILQAPAIFVSALVLERRMELRDQVAMRGMNFDAVEPGLLRAYGGRDVRRGCLHDARLGHCLRHDGLERRLIDRMRYR